MIINEKYVDMNTQANQVVPGTGGFIYHITLRQESGIPELLRSIMKKKFGDHNFGVWSIQ